jgi:hypothetical protein
MLRFYALHRLTVRLASTGCGRSGGTLRAGAVGLGQPRAHGLSAAEAALSVQGVCAGAGARGRSAAPPQRGCQRLSHDRAAACTGAPDARACGAGAERRPGAPGPAHHPDAAHGPSPGRPAAAPRAPLGRYRLRRRGGPLLGARPLAGQGRVLLPLHRPRRSRALAGTSLVARLPRCASSALCAKVWLSPVGSVPCMMECARKPAGCTKTCRDAPTFHDRCLAAGALHGGPGRVGDERARAQGAGPAGPRDVCRLGARVPGGRRRALRRLRRGPCGCGAQAQQQPCQLHVAQRSSDALLGLG